jgi:hypothetical protein
MYQYDSVGTTGLPYMDAAIPIIVNYMHQYDSVGTAGLPYIYVVKYICTLLTVT